jgi:hypothetical protein
MTRSLRRRALGPARWASAVALTAGVLLASACSPDRILDVEIQDIIDPRDVRSAAGANAVRIGAISRFVSATTGDAEFLVLSGLFADEWINGDSFIARQEIDQRTITPQNSFLLAANRQLHRARLSAEQAVALLSEYAPNAPGWQKAEMYFIQAYVKNTMAEHYCNGLIFSTVVDGREEFGSPITTTQAYEQALALTTDGLAAVSGTTADAARARNALRLIRGRILLNLKRYDEAAAAVAEVPSDFKYVNRHSQTTNSNYIWLLNNDARRYSISAGEGPNGLNFATAGDPRVPVCVGGSAACKGINVSQTVRDDLASPLHVQMMWPTRESEVDILRGQEARLIEAEAILASDPAGAIAKMNAARATVPGLDPLTDPGTAAARIDLLFRERAFWNFGRGARVGDLRRLIRQYGRTADAVFPTGEYHKFGTYGTDVNFPVPVAEENNPNAVGCMDRGA